MFECAGRGAGSVGSARSQVLQQRVPARCGSSDEGLVLARHRWGLCRHSAPATTSTGTSLKNRPRGAPSAATTRLGTAVRSSSSWTMSTATQRTTVVRTCGWCARTSTRNRRPTRTATTAEVDTFDAVAMRRESPTDRKHGRRTSKVTGDRRSRPAPALRFGSRGPAFSGSLKRRGQSTSVPGRAAPGTSLGR